ncbi:MAG: hypothetical protein ACOH1V_09535 [Stenotrophomonas sp.]
MKTYSLHRIAILTGLLLSRAAFASTPPADLAASAVDQTSSIQPTPAETVTTSGTPSLPGIPYLSLPRPPDNAPRQPVPQDIADFILALPPTDLAIPATALQQAMQKTMGTVMEVPRISGRPDRLVKIYADQDSAFWVRTFESANPDIQGYLVQVKISCDLLRDIRWDSIAGSPWRRCLDSDRPSMGSGLRAYLKIAGQPLKDVTASITSPERMLGTVTQQGYEQQGASLPFLDGSRLDRVPVARWIVESDPDNPLRKDAHTFGKGRLAHAGFLTWNGKHFETRATVTAALWPCIDKTPRKDSWACPKDDRFVISP